MLKTKFNKKGEMSFQMVLLVLAVVMLIFLLFFAGDFKDLLFNFTGKVEVAFADCDLDGVENQIDRCPCDSTLGEGEKSPNLIGCKKGTSLALAAEDRRTCTSFLHKDGSYKDQCREEKPELCTIRCSDVHDTAVAVEDKKPGIETEGDLTLALVSFAGKSDAELKGKYIAPAYSESYGASYPVLEIPIELRVLNIGSGDIVNEFKVKAEVCDQFGSNCREKYVQSISQLDVRGEEALSFTVSVGINGDSCDSGGTNNNRECLLKIKADADDVLAEPKQNNELKVVVRIEGQNLGDTYDSQFQKFQIMLVVSDGSDGTAIDEYCAGDDFNACVAQFTQSRGGIDGSFPSYVPNAGNCWAFAVEYDVADDDGGAGQLEQGVVIPHIVSKKLIPSLEYSVGSTDNSKEAFNEELFWNAKTDGSLICKDGWWHQCSSGEAGVLYANNKRFVCNKQLWKPED